MTSLSDNMYTAEAASFVGVRRNTIRKKGGSWLDFAVAQSGDVYRVIQRTDLDKLRERLDKPIRAK